MRAGLWLRLRIPLLLLGAGGLFLFVDHRLGVAERQREIARTMLAHSNGTVMEAGALFDSPLYADAAEKHRHLVQLATPKFVRFAAIVDAQGRIVDASPDSLRGRLLAQVLGADPDAPAEIERRVEGLHSKLISSSLMFGIGPMGPRPRADGLRIALAQDIHERLGRAERDASEQTLPAALVLLVFVGILAIVLDRWLHAPARKLIETAERITAGDRSARTHLTGNHDLGLAGEAFDRMATAVEQSERELREARHLLETVVQSMPVGVSLIDRDDLTVKLSNQRWRENFMLDLGSGENIVEGFRRHRIERPDGTPYSFDEMATPTVIRTGKPVQMSDVVHVTADGERVPFLVYAEPVSLGTGRDFDAVLVISQDRRELVRLVEELKVWERRFDQVARMTHQIVFEIDLTTGSVIRSGDPKALLGYGPGSAATASLAQWRRQLHPDDSQRIQNRFDHCLATGETFDEEYRFLRGENECIVVHDRAFFDIGADGRPVRMFGSVIDITAQKHLEEQLRQMQKMETVGTLAGGVAHDFNNQLTGIIGHLELLWMALPDSDERRSHVRIARAAAERCAELTRGLLAFSRRLASDPRPTQPQRLVDESLLLLGSALPANVRLETAIDAELPAVLVDAVQIEQVLLNLCVNARDAMPSGGVLRITATEVVVNKNDRRSPLAQPGHFVELGVSDDGEGISAEVLARIFEPFFTTKAVGSGTGLGLAMAYGIVSKHHGWIEVESALGEGSTFRVLLPVARVAADAAGPPREDTDAMHGNGEWVLVVDDELVVRELASYLLESNGYHTLTAKTGDEALQVFAEHSGRIRVVVLDMVMPGMSSTEVLRVLSMSDPTVRVIVSTGYSLESLPETGETAERLQKPYDRSQLLTAVRKALTPRPALTG
jgi:signal transduction histidine kinase/CheY-like chemotaxis protein/HAMP domain-containing protein